MQRTLVVGTAGHIDHGKSALVRALTGTDPDRLKEEQARGITIDLGFAHTDVGDVTLSFVDVPGHERFVRNMLAGAGGIDAVVLVIAADESVMPQTREHFHICRLLGLRAGVIALTKSDLADEDMRALAALEARELAAGSFLADAPIVPVSVRTGEGLDALRAALAALGQAPPRRDAGRPVRLPIDRVFTVRGFGTVVTGTLVSGTLATDSELVILPAGRPVKVRGVQVHGAPAASATAGQRTAVNLAGVDAAELSRGATLAAPLSLTCATAIDVAFDLLGDARPLAHGTRVRVHQGTAEVSGRVALAASGGEDVAPSVVATGTSAVARIRLEAPLVVTRGDRFILRAWSPRTTIGGGVLLDPEPPRGGVRTARGRERFRRLGRDVDDVSLVRAVLEERGSAGVTRALIIARLGFAPSAAAALLQGLVTDAVAMRAGDVWIAASVAARLADDVVALVARHHVAEPLSEGVPREEVRERLFAHAAPGVFDALVDDLTRRGRIAGRDRLAAAGHRLTLTDQDAAALERLEAALRDAGLAALEPAAAAARASLTSTDADRLSALLVRRGRVVRAGGLLFHREALDRLVVEIRNLKAGGETHLDVATFKARYGLTRKFAIPLLELLDRERVTRRVGDRRLVL